METHILPVDASRLGVITAKQVPNDILDSLEIRLNSQSIDVQNLLRAAEQIRTSDIPVAFPTETVYGLGADATRSDAVRGIYKAKQRPSDNPLIVHFSSLEQIRSVLQPRSSSTTMATDSQISQDPIPSIYHELIKRFWPGPLTIILPNPSPSPLAPEVTAGLTTFGARIPRHALALALIHTSGVPLAAPSANASTKPSPTAAEHVAHDLQGRINTILDGGPCAVGVESTVVDGLSIPPSMLRPGGISLDQIRKVPGWEATQIAYKNVSEAGTAPRAPGMKYRHYSPKATVVLYEARRAAPTLSEMRETLEGAETAGAGSNIGLVRTKTWNLSLNDTGDAVQIYDIRLGPQTSAIARGIFSALRALDRENVDVIFVEGIDDENDGEDNGEVDAAAAVMNRLRKAAEIHI
ncbi:translation factor [Dissoconium aciculare CBS 342.82]|uniref:Threonylcarbamoyl-AMP synthase n=1 Tax=Dissoconium aciculare CBS 342.82 TaxID=1314786 RepID=A0A6J3LYI3_9PEZI|nr:translation factor [Dissoconium aciculare CBS 342.82]KAF1820830.1 translation factor [Dissoconium aciculare CBS 342.82]